MIKKFSVKNFKNFKDELVVDFSCVHDYEFNKHLIKNGLVNKMLIYGPNNSGKSNLGAAIMDITRHLTDMWQKQDLYLFYSNGDNESGVVDFKYEFLLENQNIVYSYQKDDLSKLLYEELYVDGKLLFNYNYKNNKYTNNIEEAKNLDLSKNNNDISVLKYIYNNNIYWDKLSPVKLLMEFVSHMLWFRSLRDNEFMGLLPHNENLNNFIFEKDLLKDFEKFLNDCGQNYKLTALNHNGKKLVAVNYKKTSALFELVASTGTLALWLFYYWMNRLDNISFIYLDEFDAFYHYELSSYILKYVNNKKGFQSILTTHNTYLADNELMRPDCYFILNNNKLKSFSESTNKVIRQGHNLEKMLIGGEFGA